MLVKDYNPLNNIRIRESLLTCMNERMNRVKGQAPQQKVHSRRKNQTSKAPMWHSTEPHKNRDEKQGIYIVSSPPTTSLVITQRKH